MEGNIKLDITWVKSDIFINLPAEVQNLYFHLMVNADENGKIINPKAVARMLGVNESRIEDLWNVGCLWTLGGYTPDSILEINTDVLGLECDE